MREVCGGRNIYVKGKGAKRAFPWALEFWVYLSILLLHDKKFILTMDNDRYERERNMYKFGFKIGYSFFIRIKIKLAHPSKK